MRRTVVRAGAGMPAWAQAWVMWGVGSPAGEPFVLRGLGVDRLGACGGHVLDHGTRRFVDQAQVIQ